MQNYILEIKEEGFKKIEMEIKQQSKVKEVLEENIKILQNNLNILKEGQKISHDCNFNILKENFNTLHCNDVKNINFVIFLLYVFFSEFLEKIVLF